MWTDWTTINLKIVATDACLHCILSSHCWLSRHPSKGALRPEWMRSHALMTAQPCTLHDGIGLTRCIAL